MFPNMHACVAVALLLAACSHAKPHSHLHKHSRRAPVQPTVVAVKSTKYLCDVESKNTNTVRDLGYVGQIGSTVVHTYGDTLNGPNSSFYMTSDSSGVGVKSPCYFVDAALENGNHPAQFVPIMAKYGETNTADAMGGTNVIGTGSNEGMMFYLKNHRPAGSKQYLVGAGVAYVTISNGVPSATRPAENWWDTQAGEPNYGDITAFSNSDYIWGLGHGGGGLYSYLTRVRKGQYKKKAAWQYWDGSTGKWSSKHLYNPKPAQGMQWNDAEGAAYGVGQGQMIWSPYYQKILFVYALSWASGDGNTAILARTADSPKGPWSKAVQLFEVTPITKGGLVYAPIPNPYFDDTGKTLIVTLTNSPNVLQAHRVTFK